MAGPDYTKTEDAIRDYVAGKVIFVTRTDSFLYPIYIDFVAGDVAPILERLQAASPYPLAMRAAAYTNIFEYLQWQRKLSKYSARRCGNWWARSSYLEQIIDQLLLGDEEITEHETADAVPVDAHTPEQLEDA